MNVALVPDRRLVVMFSTLAVLAGCAERHGVYGPPAGEPPPAYGRTPAPPPVTVRPVPPPVVTRPAPTVPTQPAISAPVAPVPMQPTGSPAILALLAQAETSRAGGNLEGAVAITERALRIEPRNARLIHTLADLRLQQKQPKLAEDLAKKSNALAAGDRALIRNNWLIIASARRQMGDAAGAAEAEARARNY